MAESRDDFIIAIRSAFLKKSTKQKFSLLTLVFFSIFIIVLSNFNFKAITVTKSVIKEIVYRSSFIVSIPENFIKSSYLNLTEYTNFYKEFKITKEELDQLKSENISTKIIGALEFFSLILSTRGIVFLVTLFAGKIFGIHSIM